MSLIGIPRLALVELSDLEGFFWLLSATVLAALVWASVTSVFVIEAKGAYCMKCGYDLIFNTNGRCPECGTADAALKIETK